MKMALSEFALREKGIYGVLPLVSGKLLLRIRKYLINNIFRGQTPVHDLKCLHLQSVS